MTTPERLRRRQRLEGAALVVLGVITLGYGVWDSDRASDRDECIAENFLQASKISNLRAELAQEASELTIRSDAAQDRLIEQLAVARADNRLKEIAFREYAIVDDQIDKQQAELLERRKNTTIPEYPTGVCT